jgi:hypothetical protein
VKWMWRSWNPAIFEPHSNRWAGKDLFFSLQETGGLSLT